MATSFLSVCISVAVKRLIKQFLSEPNVNNNERVGTVIMKSTSILPQLSLSRNVTDAWTFDSVLSRSVEMHSRLNPITANAINVAFPNLVL